MSEHPDPLLTIGIPTGDGWRRLASQDQWTKAVTYGDLGPDTIVEVERRSGFERRPAHEVPELRTVLPASPADAESPATRPEPPDAPKAGNRLPDFGQAPGPAYDDHRPGLAQPESATGTRDIRPVARRPGVTSRRRTWIVVGGATAAVAIIIGIVLTNALGGGETSGRHDSSHIAETPGAAGALPDDFSYAEAQGVLDGRVTSLSRAFSGAKSSQGKKYWDQQSATLTAGGRISPQAQRIVRQWLEAAREEAGPLPSKFVAGRVKAALAGDSDGLNYGFDWRASKQQQPFWDAEFQRLSSHLAMSSQASRILRTWLALNG